MRAGPAGIGRLVFVLLALPSAVVLLAPYLPNAAAAPSAGRWAWNLVGLFVLIVMCFGVWLRCLRLSCWLLTRISPAAVVFAFIIYCVSGSRQTLLWGAIALGAIVMRLLIPTGPKRAMIGKDEQIGLVY